MKTKTLSPELLHKMDAYLHVNEILTGGRAPVLGEAIVIHGLLR